MRQTFQTESEQYQPNLIRQADGSTALMVDFEGPVLAKLPPGTAPETKVSVNGNAQLIESSLQPNPVTQGWRLTLRVKVKDPAQPTELRAALAQGDKAISETWSFQIPPHPQAAAAAAAPAPTPASTAATQR